MIKVLLVDGSEGTRRGLRMRLRLESDLEVVGEAADAESALALVESLEPDVVLMDLELPGLNGCEATRRLRARHPNTAVVILTLYGDAAKRRAAAEAGACHFKEKDADCNALVEAVRRAARKLDVVEDKK